ncbi:MAG TPA: outer membrane beta-barrel protein [Bacteroidia bacterium]
MYTIKTICVMAALAFTLNSSRANAQAFEQGRSVISAGYGLGNFTQAVFKAFETEAYEDFKYKGIGPFFLKYEYAISDKVGIGLNYAYIGAKVSYEEPSRQVSPGVNYKQEIKFSSMSFLPRLNFHFGTSEKVDPYFGFGIGYRTASYAYSDNDPNYDNDEKINSLNPFGMDLTIGARFFFTESIGAYLEAGMAKGIIQFGLSAKM